MRNEEVTELLPRLELMRRSDFESDGAVPPKLAKLHAELVKMTKRFQFKAVATPRYEEEHHTWSVSFTDSQGAERRIDWTLGVVSGVPADDGEVLADSGGAGAAVRHRVRAKSRLSPKKLEAVEVALHQKPRRSLRRQKTASPQTR